MGHFHNLKAHMYTNRSLQQGITHKIFHTINLKQSTSAGHAKSCRKLWCRLETIPEEPQRMLVSWIHPMSAITLSYPPDPVPLIPYFSLWHFSVFKYTKYPSCTVNVFLETGSKGLIPAEEEDANPTRVSGIACVLWKGKPDVICWL